MEPQMTQAAPSRKNYRSKISKRPTQTRKEKEGGAKEGGRERFIFKTEDTWENGKEV